MIKLAFLMVVMTFSTFSFGIVGGARSEIEDFPFLIGLHSCGAVKVSHDKILTAAHCIAFKPRVGVYKNDTDYSIEMHRKTSREDPLTSANSIVAKVKKVFIYPSFFGRFITEGISRDLQGLDIAILELEDSPFLDSIDTIPPLSFSINEGDKIVAMGWGIQTDGLSSPQDLYAQQRLYDTNPRLADGHLKSVEIIVKEVKKDFYVGSDFDSANKPTRVAPGDSGGPAIVVVDGKHYLAGIGSYRTQGGGDSHFSRIDGALTWIRMVLQGKVSPTRWAHTEDEWELDHKSYFLSILENLVPFLPLSLGHFEVSCSLTSVRGSFRCLKKTSTHPGVFFEVNQEQLDQIVRVFEFYPSLDSDPEKRPSVSFLRNISCFTDDFGDDYCISWSDKVNDNLKKSGLISDFFQKNFLGTIN